MNRIYAIYGLQFDDHQVTHQHVHAIRIVDGHPLVPEWEHYLAFALDTCGSELDLEALFICGLKESWPQRPVYVEGGGNDLTAQLIRATLGAGVLVSASIYSVRLCVRRVSVVHLS